MPQIIEDHKSRELVRSSTGGSATYMYTLKGYVDEDSALTALFNYSPAAVSALGMTLIRDTGTVKPVVIGSNSDKTLFKGVMTYKSHDATDLVEPVEPSDDGIVTADFNERAHDVTNALDAVHVGWDSNKWTYWDSMEYMEANNINFTKRSPPALYGRQINKYAPDQPALGTQKNIPSSTFSISKIFSAKQVNNLWFAQRMSQVWTLNQYTFRDLAPRTVAFTGMSSAQSTDGNWTVDFNFEFRPRITNYIITRKGVPFRTKNLPNARHPLDSANTDQQGFDMCAWDYLYLRDSSDSLTGDVVVDSFSVCQLYESTNFALLGV